jgi:hypothetical protein
MGKDIPGAGWGTDCETAVQYDNDNYYLLTWDDPNCMEIRNTNQVIAALGVSLAEDDAPWSRHGRNASKQPTRDIKELMDWLNAEQDESERVPSDNFICDECGYVWIRRILTKHEE